VSLAQAMDAYKERLGEYPPDFGYIADCSSQLNAVQAHIARAFPQCLPQYNPASPPAICQYPYLYLLFNNGIAGPGGNPNVGANLSLCFWLAGPAGNGFSADPQDPFDIKTYSQGLPPQPSRIGPFFNFAPDRIAFAVENATPAASATSLYVGNGTLTLFRGCECYPDNGLPAASASNAPYLYFAARNGSYIYLPPSGGNPLVTAYSYTWPQGYNPTPNLTPNGAMLLAPYADLRLPPNGNFPAFVNAKTFQILCPGLDGMYAYPTDNNNPVQNAAWGFYNSGTNYRPETMDDITNFTNGATLADDMPQ